MSKQIEKLNQIPRKVWGATAAKDWKPKTDYPEIRVVRFRELYNFLLDWLLRVEK